MKNMFSKIKITVIAFRLIWMNTFLKKKKKKKWMNTYSQAFKKNKVFHSLINAS